MFQIKHDPAGAGHGPYGGHEGGRGHRGPQCGPRTHEGYEGYEGPRGPQGPGRFEGPRGRCGGPNEHDRSEGPRGHGRFEGPCGPFGHGPFGHGPFGRSGDEGGSGWARWHRPHPYGMRQHGAPWRRGGWRRDHGHNHGHGGPDERVRGLRAALGEIIGQARAADPRQRAAIESVLRDAQARIAAIRAESRPAATML